MARSANWLTIVGVLGAIVWVTARLREQCVDTQLMSLCADRECDCGGPQPESPDDLIHPEPVAPRSALVDPQTGMVRPLTRYEGSTYCPGAVSPGLQWLAAHQNANGSWSLDRFDQAPSCKARCGDAGFRSDTTATAVVLLAFLGAGQTHKQGRHKKAVDNGLKWLIKQQKPDGDLRGEGGLDALDTHAMATLVLCSACDMTADKSLSIPVRQALRFITQSQNGDGGWGKSPRDTGDLSITAWHLMALRAGRLANFKVPDTTFDRVRGFLDQCQTDKSGAHYARRPGATESPEATATALLGRALLGWPADHPGFREGSEPAAALFVDQKELNPQAGYFAVQLIHRLPDGQILAQWRNGSRDRLLKLQEKAGHAKGSWKPFAKSSEMYGRLYATAMAICTLEVYYRHLPVYQHRGEDE